MRRTLCGLAIAVATLAPGWARATDAEDKATAQRIAAVLKQSGRMQAYEVGVKYKDGTVWLAGRVTSNEQMQTALQVVSDTEGVEQIVNNLTVGPGKNSPAKKPVPVAAGKSNIRLANATAGTAQQASPNASRQPLPQGSGNVPAGFHHMRGGPACGPGGPGMAGGPGMMGGPVPAMGGGGPAAYDQPHMPNYAWPSYAAAPNYAALTYPKQYSASAFPFIGPFYPYPQVPLGWRKVSLEWDDGWWFLDFQDRGHH